MHKRIVYWQVICDGCGKETRVDLQKYFPPKDSQGRVWAGDIYYKTNMDYNPNRDYCPECVEKKEIREVFK